MRANNEYRKRIGMEKEKGKSAKPKYRYENAFCKSVYDGDTFTAVIDYGNKLTQEVVVRMANINTPEIRTKSAKEKKRGMEAKSYLASRIEGKPIILESLKMEKYGRLLCKVYDRDGIELNREMIEKKHAVPFMEVSEEYAEPGRYNNGRNAGVSEEGGA